MRFHPGTADVPGVQHRGGHAVARLPEQQLLDGGLGGAVVAERVARLVLSHRHRLGSAVHPDRAAVHQVGVAAGQRVDQLLGGLGGEAHQVDHSVHAEIRDAAAEATFAVLGGAVDDDPLDLFPLRCVDVRLLLTAAESHHVVAGGDQHRHEEASDVSGRSDDRHPHRRVPSWSGRRRAARPRHQRGRDGDVRLCLGAVDACQQQCEPATADFVEVLVHRGQSRREVLRLRDVVETDDADVFGHSATALAEGVQQPERHLVVGGEDRSHVVARGQLEARDVAGTGAPVAGQRIGHVGIGVLQRRAPALGSQHRLAPVAGALHVPHRAVAEVEQVTSGEPGPLLLVDGDHRLVAELGFQGHHRHVGRQHPQRLHRVVGGCDHDDAVDGL